MIAGLATLAVITLCWKANPAARPPGPVTALASQHQPASARVEALQSGRNSAISSNRRNRADLAAREFLALKARAEGGDAVAQRQLANRYADCIWVNLGRQRFLATYDSMARITKDPTSAKLLPQVARLVADDCAVVDGGAVIPMEAFTLWLEQAAKHGDLAAQMRLRVHRMDLPQGDALRDVVEQVMASGDPAAMFVLGDVVSATKSDQGLGRYADVAQGSVAGYAWYIAACRQGLDCGPQSRIMYGTCLASGTCASTDYETFVRQHLFAGEQAALLDEKVAEITKLLNERQ